MPQIGIQLEDVSRAVEALEGQGRVASPTNVRLQLGETGSYSTIQRLLAQVKKTLAEQRAAPAMSESLQKLAAECIAKLWATAYSEAHSRLEALERKHRLELDSLRGELERAQTDAGRLEFEISRVATDLSGERVRLASMGDQITEATNHTHSLEGVIDELRCERRALIRGLRRFTGAASLDQGTAKACNPTATNEAVNQGAFKKAHQRLAISR